MKVTWTVERVGKRWMATAKGQGVGVTRDAVSARSWQSIASFLGVCPTPVPASFPVRITVEMR